MPGSPRLLAQAGTRSRAIPLSDIAEIIRVPPAAPVPLSPPWLCGLISHRGSIVPMIDLGQRLGGEPCTPTAQSRVIIATAGAGFLVQRIEAAGALEAAEEALDLAGLLASEAPAAPPAAHGGQAKRHDSAPEAAPYAAGDDTEALLGIVVAGEAYAWALDGLEAVARFAADAAGSAPQGAARMAWRGASLPVLSLRRLLGAAGEDDPQPGRVVVLRLGDGTHLALRVDGFSGILRVPARQRHPVPALLARGRPLLESLCRLDGGLVCVLSAASLAADGAAAPASPTAVRAAAPTPDTAAQRFIVYRLGSARFAAPLAAIDEVLRDAPLTPVPGAPAHVAGLRRLRGRVLPVVDLRQDPAAGGDASKTLVCMLDHDVQAGFKVDGVERILTLAPQAVRPASGLPRAAAALVTHVLSEADDGPLLPVLDLEQFLAALGGADALPGESLAALLAALPLPQAAL